MPFVLTFFFLSQGTLLTDGVLEDLRAEEQGAERRRAFDLLDALTKSGVLPMRHAALHVIIAATHRFDKSVMGTLIENNVNPVEKIERSLLIVASTIHHAPAEELVLEEQVQRVLTYSPTLAVAH